MTSIVPNNIEKNNKDTRMLRAALAYAERLQWSVFPVRAAGKTPITNNGLKAATTDREQIIKWWTTYPNANIGIATGSISGFFVLDVDIHGVDGKRTLEGLEQQHGVLPDTVQAITGSRGEHYLFKYRDGIKNKVNFQPGLDIRGDGGYIVASPSMHSSGRCYEWECSSRPIENEVAEAPQWLLKMITEPFFTMGEVPQPKPSSHWQKLMAGLSEGEGRNPAATSIFGHLMRKRVDSYLAIELMKLWNERNNPPLDEGELHVILSSIMRKEAERRGLE